MGAAPSTSRLGDLAVEAGFLTAEALAEALEESRESGTKLGETLVRRGILSGPALANLLADQAGAPVRTEWGIGTGFRPRPAAASRPQAVQAPPAQAEGPGEEDGVVERLERRIADQARQIMKNLEALAERDRLVAELRRELEDLRAETLPAAADGYLLAVSGSGSLRRARGVPPAVGSLVTLPDAPGVVYRVEAHDRETQVTLGAVQAAVA